MSLLKNKVIGGNDEIVIPRLLESKKQLNWDWSGTITNLKKALTSYAEVEEQNIFYDIKMRLHRILVRMKLKKR